VAVSHDVDLVRRLCTRALWLEGGHVRLEADVETVARTYVDHVGLDPSVLA
jgi:lipopolysaccharide transport system ATP-binding protein